MSFVDQDDNGFLESYYINTFKTELQKTLGLEKSFPVLVSPSCLYLHSGFTNVHIKEVKDEWNTVGNARLLISQPDYKEILEKFLLKIEESGNDKLYDFIYDKVDELQIDKDNDTIFILFTAKENDVTKMYMVFFNY